MNNKVKFFILSFFFFPILGSVEVNLHAMFPFSIKEDSGEHGVIDFNNKAVCENYRKPVMECEKKLAVLSENLIFNFTENSFYKYDLVDFDYERPIYEVNKVAAEKLSDGMICICNNCFNEKKLLDHLVSEYFRKNTTVNGIRPCQFIEVFKQQISECWKEFESKRKREFCVGEEKKKRALAQ